ncbi:MAG: YecA family protein [Natronospirillum sp.]|uniref:UPF0149 family protein n=1 Tax=Natronospirillum sp. TaxID=2812955 RepID=UPI0025D1F682|nr:UPF0149 family protein [Natronospirillum sp.]MCH8552968.1 YecA family protein [Natronospirillum sp.]
MEQIFEAMAEQLDELAGQDTLDAESVHGALTLWAITGKGSLPEDFSTHVFGDDLASVNTEDRLALETLWQDLLDEIGQGLYDDSEPELPFDSTLDWQDSDQQSWCIGFMEMLFREENAFGHVRDDALAELLLPIQVGSGLFAEEADFSEIYRDQPLLANILQQIPNVLVDLYLLCNVPE